MLARTTIADTATWRPQLFGDKRAASITDPIIEPLWTGPRILAAVGGDGSVRLTDVDGEAVAGHDDIAGALRTASGGATVIVEAFLTAEPMQDVTEIAGRESIQVPNPTQAMTQMIIGTRGARKDRLVGRKDEARLRTIDGAVDRVALVAVDLIWLDDESLCDIPLLERRRILESVLIEGDLVRVGIHVKPPVASWLGSWRAFGFRRLAYKAANSRYLPGLKNQEWATAEIPQR